MPMYNSEIDNEKQAEMDEGHAENNIPVRPERTQVMLANIPDEIKLLARWCVWQYQLTQNKQGEWHWTKPPLQPLLDKQKQWVKASSTNIDTWHTFDDCWRVYNKKQDLDGIGFFLADPYVAADRDDCLDSDRLVATTHLCNAMNSYTETSPSGNGIRILVKGKLAHEKKTNFVELYSKGRYVTITGWHRGDYPLTIEERQEPLDRLTYSLTTDDPDEADDIDIPEVDPTTKLSDDEFIALCTKHETSFPDLFAGKVKGRNPSEADWDFMCCLARHTRDATRLDRVYRRAGLRRKKWDEGRGKQGTYGSMTIAKALRRVPLDDMLHAKMEEVEEMAASWSVPRTGSKSEGLCGEEQAKVSSEQPELSEYEKLLGKPVSNIVFVDPFQTFDQFRLTLGEEREMLIDGLLRRGMAHLLSALAKDGKTTLSINLFVQLLYGRVFGKATKPLPILYLDYENDRHDFEKTILRATAGQDLAPLCQHLHIASAYHADPAQTPLPHYVSLEWLKLACSKYEKVHGQPGIFAIDTFLRAFEYAPGLPPNWCNDPSTISHLLHPFSLFCKQTGWACWLLTHDGWNGHTRGSTEFHGAVDAISNFKREKDSNFITLKTKGRFGSPVADKVLTYTDGRYQFQGDPKDHAKKQEDKTAVAVYEAMVGILTAESPLSQTKLVDKIHNLGLGLPGINKLEKLVKGAEPLGLVSIGAKGYSLTPACHDKLLELQLGAGVV